MGTPDPECGLLNISLYYPHSTVILYNYLERLSRTGRFNPKQKELPDQLLFIPERRAKRVAQITAGAPISYSESRTRSVPFGLNPIKQAAGEYLTSG